MSTERGFIVAIGGAEERSRHGAILRRFVRLCGGRRARLAIIPTASQLDATGPDYEKVFCEIGAHSARSLPFDERADCEREDFLEILSEADGVFITGGNQLRLSTILGGTRVADLLRRRNLEGMTVGGTSAGAAILSEHMIAYGEEGLQPRAGKATLSPGLGFVRWAIVDQHFSQRNRLGRLLTALAYNPRLLGLGIDEDTAALIGPDDSVEVHGQGMVTVVDASQVEHSSIDEAAPGELVSLDNVRIHLLLDGACYLAESRRAHPQGHPEIGRRFEEITRRIGGRGPSRR
ncbi:MAG TPA: cyanophycinase [Thermoanaerobaculia bacterium]|nr:cyanophycinase [Thermoanaerobaculia bacterium]